jgi:hypothetical protein
MNIDDKPTENVDLFAPNLTNQVKPQQSGTKHEMSGYAASMGISPVHRSCGERQKMADFGAALQQHDHPGDLVPVTSDPRAACGE